MDPLLQALERNPLIPKETLSKMLGMSVEDISKKVQAYEAQGVIVGYKAIINHDNLEQERVKAVIEVRVVPQREGGFDRTAERIAQFDEVTSCFLMSGGFDILIFVEGKTLTQVATFVSSKLATLENVQSTATHFMLKTYKDHGILMGKAHPHEQVAVTP
jgi:DNA-binding Lrp family transcriptional regulator